MNLLVPGASFWERFPSPPRSFRRDHRKMSDCDVRTLWILECGIATRRELSEMFHIDKIVDAGEIWRNIFAYERLSAEARRAGLIG